MRDNKFKTDDYANLIFSIFFFIVFGAILTMAKISKFNVHPDEFVHEKAACYYKNHSLPPAISDPEIQDTFSGYGNSRLVGFESYYLFVGKFSVVTDTFIDDPIFAMRLFNVLLFFILMLMFMRSRQEMKPFFLVLLISPQIWYLFSYLNSDAFALFISLNIIYQVANNKSWLHKFLFSDKLFGCLGGALFFAMLLALQILSKKNFWFVLVFLVAVACYQLIVEKQKNKILILKIMMIGGFALIMLFPRYAYELKLYGSEREVVLKNFKEEKAQDGFKRANVHEDVSYHGIFLKEKGVGYSELFGEKWNWHKLTFFSFVGLYNNMTLWSPSVYYKLMFMLYALLLGFITFKSLYKQDWSQRFLPLVFYAFLLMIVGLASYQSWVSDFQAQGRYLFAILVILGFWFVKSPIVNRSTIFKVGIFVIACASMYSFIYTALMHIPKV